MKRTLTNYACTLTALLLLSSACSLAPRAGSSNSSNSTTASAPRKALDFDGYMHADFAPADGFDFPFGDFEGGGSYKDAVTGKRYDGWYVATQFAERYSLGLHTGEDWNAATGSRSTIRTSTTLRVAAPQVC